MLPSPAYTNNEINSEKNNETNTYSSAVVGGQHIVKLTISPFAKNYFRFISLVGYTLFLIQPNLGIIIDIKTQGIKNYILIFF